MEDFTSICVEKGEKVEVVHNPTSYPLIGRGKQGAVFKISSDRCVKIYAKKKNVLNESKVLKAAQESPIVPKLYEVGTNYIVMEYIEGPSLTKYLKSEGVFIRKSDQPNPRLAQRNETIKIYPIGREFKAHHRKQTRGT